MRTTYHFVLHMIAKTGRKNTLPYYGASRYDLQAECDSFGVEKAYWQTPEQTDMNR